MHKLQLSLTVLKNTTSVKVLIHNTSPEVNTYFDTVEVTFNDYTVQENHYYPLGMNMAGIEKEGAPDHKFQYNGKEKQEGMRFVIAFSKWYKTRVNVQNNNFINVDDIE